MTSAWVAAALLLGAQEDAGWTRIAPARDARLVHVSASGGSDAADGLSPLRPVRTLARGKALLRHGFPDRLLLKAGDAWDEPLGGWSLGGRSRAEPMVVAPYGEGPRPLIRPGGKPGLLAAPAPGAATASVEHLVFQGLDFYEARRDPEALVFDPSTPPAPGFFWMGEGNDILLEDCRFRFFKDAVVFQKQRGRFLTDVRIRRCIVADSWSSTSHAQGLYAEEVDSLVVEECVFDLNGWNPRVPGAVRTMFNHNLYIQTNCRRVTVRGNVLARASSHAVQLRPGGLIENNLMLRNAIGVTTAGDQVTVEGNVVVGSDDIGPGQLRGWGIEMRRCPRGSVYRRNLLLDRASAQTSAGLSLGEERAPGAAPVLVEDNVVARWNSSRGGIYVADADRPDVRMKGNIVDGKDADGRPARQPDPSRTLETYLEAKGVRGGFAAFLEQARRRERGAWDPRWTADAVNGYLRAGHFPAR
jgi:hypothetical protein